MKIEEIKTWHLTIIHLDWKSRIDFFRRNENEEKSWKAIWGLIEGNGFLFNISF